MARRVSAVGSFGAAIAVGVWLLAGSLLSDVAAAAENLDGFWIDSDGEVILEIRPCAASKSATKPSGPQPAAEPIAARCGRVAWLRIPEGPDGKPILDYRNPDVKLRNRPVCGLDVVVGFKPEGNGVWGGGSVYVSDHGMTFSGQATVLGPTKVKVTGYVGLPIFGSSEVWSRVAGPPETCAAVAARSNGAPAPAAQPAGGAAKAPVR